MALKPCIACKHQVSSDAKRCPNCGKRRPTKRFTMGKLIKFFLLLFIGVGVISALIPQSATRTPQPATPSLQKAKPSPQKVLKGKTQRILNLLEIVGKTPAEVEMQLGKPLASENTKYGIKSQYTPGGAEIVFINGKADWITVNTFGDAPYTPNTLAVLGLPVREASFRNSSVMRWNHLAGLLEVELFPEKNHVSYAYIKVTTP